MTRLESRKPLDGKLNFTTLRYLARDIEIRNKGYVDYPTERMTGLRPMSRTLQKVQHLYRSFAVFMQSAIPAFITTKVVIISLRLHPAHDAKRLLGEHGRADDGHGRTIQ